jgi:hypothetical protein
MELADMAEQSASLDCSIARLACLDPSAAPFLPNFLIISPPKTGSTWLATNLRCHPRIFIPAIKEIKYFSTYYRWLPLNWYVRHFQPGGDRLKGEASPSYAVLPRRMIRLLHTLVPQLKLIFLMRDPAARAWSHAKHNHRFKEANFRECAATIDSITDEQWRDNFSHPWALASGDYLGQLRRWLSVFPRRQVLVDFYERIQADPIGLLSRIMEFLEEKPPLDWSSYPHSETILAGPAKAISDGLKSNLRRLFEERTQELAAFLDDEFNLNVEDRWVETLGEGPAAECELKRLVSAGAQGGAGALTEEDGRRTDTGSSFLRPVAAMRPPAFFAHELDDNRLERLLHENDCASPRVMEEGFHGYKIVLHRGRFFAVALTLADVNLDALDEAAARTRGEVLVADSLERAKEVVMHHVIGDLRCELAMAYAGQESLRVQLAEYPPQLSALRDSLAAQEAQHRELVRQFAECQIFVSRFRNSWLFRLRRRLAQFLTARPSPRPASIKPARTATP